MDSRKIILLVGALIVAGVTAFFARTLIAGSSTPQATASAIQAPVIDGPEVLVATRALPVGTILDATALKFQPWPKELVDGAYFLKPKTNLQALQGTVVRNAITAGQPVTQGALVKPGDRGFLAAALGPGMRAVTVPVSAQAAVAGFVFPGDRIDLVLTQNVTGGGDGPPLKVSETIMRNMRVLATDQRTDNQVGEDGKTVVHTFSNVTVEATPKIAEQIAVAQTLGTLSLSLRSLADNSVQLEDAIASGSVHVPEGGDLKAEKAMMLQLASQPTSGNPTYATGADVSRFQRRSVPGKPADVAGVVNMAAAGAQPQMSGGSAPSFPGATAAQGYVVRIARGNNVTAVPVGGNDMRVSLMPIGLPMIALLVVATAAPAAHAPKKAGMREAEAPPASVPTTMLQVNTGRGRMVTLDRPMTDLFISDDTVADVQVRSPTQLYVFGKKTGETTISATGRGGAVVFATTVRVGNNFNSIQQMLGLAMPEAHVVATPMNGLVLLTGTVAAPEDAAEAERLVQAFIGDGAKVLSRLRTATPLQVNLSVRIAEVSRSFVKNVGINLMTRDTSSGFQFGLTSGRTAGTFGDPITGTGKSFATGSQRSTLGLAGRLLGLDVLSAIDLGETIGQVSTLANPNLTALSGETATFLAGGEIPIPISQGLGAVSVEYKQYGISLAYTPTVLSDGRISLRVRPEVSQLTSAGAVQLNGTTVPALTTRRVETTAQLGSGQSMVIGGLLQNNHDNSIDKTPGLGDLPILGALFRSNNFRRSETELIIIITPYLVKPIDDASALSFPTDGYRGPTDLQRIVGGELGTGTTGGRRPVPTMAQPSPAAPSIGVMAPVPPAPSRSDDRRTAADTRTKPKKGDAPAPGFSN